MLAAISAIEEFTSEMTVEAFQGDYRTVGAVLYNLAVIGEAVRGIPLEVQASNPDIPWEDMRGMRNIVIHEYFQVSTIIVWQTVREDLPLLKASLHRLIDKTF
ncbi:MAG: DUF86 domain-containing protein [Cyanobacteria bacterium P01_A01_bin.135]